MQNVWTDYSNSNSEHKHHIPLGCKEVKVENIKIETLLIRIKTNLKSLKDVTSIWITGGEPLWTITVMI